MTEEYFNEGDGLPETVSQQKPDGRYQTKEVRFVIGAQQSQVYVYVEADENCPHVQGWHYKEFPIEKSILDIFNDMIGPDTHLLWPILAPEPAELTQVKFNQGEPLCQ